MEEEGVFFCSDATEDPPAAAARTCLRATTRCCPGLEVGCASLLGPFLATVVAGSWSTSQFLNEDEDAILIPLAPPADPVCLHWVGTPRQTISRAHPRAFTS